MNSIRIFCSVALALTGVCAFGETYRDAMGRVIGTRK